MLAATPPGCAPCAGGRLNDPLVRFFSSRRRAGQVKVAVYGMSTEGYSLACRMAAGGAEVSVVDGSAHAAMELTAEAAARYPDIASLREEEPLMPMMPADLAVSGARYVFFAPVVRPHSSGAGVDSYPLFKAAASPIKKGGSLVYMLPAGIGDSAENMSSMERLTGLSAGRSAGYYYCPASGPDLPAVGSKDGLPDEELAGLLEDGGRPGFATFPSAEALHALDVVERFAKISAALETAYNLRHEAAPGDLDRFGGLFLDDMVGGVYDLRVLRAASPPPGVITYVANGSLRAIDAYVRRLAGAVRSLSRKPEFKTRRVRVAVAWTHDEREMRSDRRSALRFLLDQLRDRMGEADMLEDLDAFHTEELIFAVPCSRRDYERVRASKGPNLVIIKANPACETEA